MYIFFVLQGPISGNTIIEVTGTGFMEGTSCMFGNVNVESLFINSTNIRCVSPIISQAATIDFGVQNIYSSLMYSDNTVEFKYYGNLAPFLGEDRVIKLFLTYFQVSKNLFILRKYGKKQNIW